MPTYQEQIAQWRRDRAQQQVNNRLQEIRQEHAEAVRERDLAIGNNDMEMAELRDMDCQQLEQEWHHYNPPRPQVNPQWQNWIQRNASFVEREGERGVKAVTDALAYMQRPRNPNSNDPRYSGMGLTPQQVFSKQGLDKLEDLLETHGSQFYGVRFDKNEQTLTPNEARDASGLDTKTYNAAYQQLKAQGRLK